MRKAEKGTKIQAGVQGKAVRNYPNREESVDRQGKRSSSVGEDRREEVLHRAKVGVLAVEGCHT